MHITEGIKDTLREIVSRTYQTTNERVEEDFERYYKTRPKNTVLEDYLAENGNSYENIMRGLHLSLKKDRELNPDREGFDYIKDRNIEKHIAFVEAYTAGVALSNYNSNYSLAIGIYLGLDAISRVSTSQGIIANGRELYKKVKDRLVKHVSKDN